jgi:hypothetical protein
MLPVADAGGSFRQLKVSFFFSLAGILVRTDFLLKRSFVRRVPKFFLYSRGAVSNFVDRSLKLIFGDVQVLGPMLYLEWIAHVDLGAIRTFSFGFHLLFTGDRRRTLLRISSHKH